MAGLASGKRPGYQPVSDAEFLRMYDPERYEHGQLMKRLDQLIEAIGAMAQPVVAPWATGPREPDRNQARTGRELARQRPGDAALVPATPRQGTEL